VQYNPDDLRLIAAHEAGHAVAALIFGFRLESVALQWRQLPGGIALVGSTFAHLPAPDEIAGRGAEAALPPMVQMLSGPAAEKQAAATFKFEMPCYTQRGLQDATGAANVALCSLVESPEELEIPCDENDSLALKGSSLCNRAKAEATRFVSANRTAIKAVTAALIAKSLFRKGPVDPLAWVQLIECQGFTTKTCIHPAIHKPAFRNRL
jgi:hypothetical protein